MMNSLVSEGEYLEDLQRNGLRIIQPRDGYRFTADSVILAHFAAEAQLSGTVVDLGTGSGIILLLLSALCPQVKLVGVELQEALAVRARRSVELNKLGFSIEVIHGDLREISSYIKPDSVETVVSNPPYIPLGKGAVNRSQEIALAKQELTCTLEEVFKAAGRILKSRGRLFMVHKPARLTDICCFSRQYAMEPKGLRFVQPSPDTAPSMILVECRKNCSSGLKLFPPLVLTDAEGQPSAEIKDMYGAEK